MTDWLLLLIVVLVLRIPTKPQRPKPHDWLPPSSMKIGYQPPTSSPQSEK